MLHSLTFENFAVAVTWPGICRAGVFCQQRNLIRELARAEHSLVAQRTICDNAEAVGGVLRFSE